MTMNGLAKGGMLDTCAKPPLHHDRDLTIMRPERRALAPDAWDVLAAPSSFLPQDGDRTEMRPTYFFATNFNINTCYDITKCFEILLVHDL